MARIEATIVVELTPKSRAVLNRLVEVEEILAELEAEYPFLTDLKRARRRLKYVWKNLEPVEVKRGTLPGT